MLVLLGGKHTTVDIVERHRIALCTLDYHLPVALIYLRVDGLHIVYSNLYCVVDDNRIMNGDSIIQSNGVINLFEGQREFSLFDEGFLAELRKMKEKNLAVLLLERLVKERIQKFERTNVVQSQKFSELLNMALSNYLKGMLTNEEVIEELLKMAAEIKKTEEEGNDLGLNTEEKAFYDALSSPEGIRDAYSDEEFIALTKELTEQLRKNRTIDWNRKETSRAKMRVLVKRLLKKYKYPPEGQEKALEVVMAQCNKWADDDENLRPIVVNVTIEKHYHGNVDKVINIEQPKE